MSRNLDETRRQGIGHQYLALHAIRELNNEVIEFVGESDSNGDLLSHIEAYEHALQRRNYTLQELMEIQVITAARLGAIAKTIQRKHRE